MKKPILFLLIALAWQMNAQKQTSQWCFGNFTGLDFQSNPPALYSTSMNVSEGCASVADKYGNLLFYTNGLTVWNKNHSVMDNGTGLLAGTSYNDNAQGVLALPLPGDTSIYYIITLSSINDLNNFNKPSGIWYSIVDMSLAAGNGSVVVKNAILSSVATTEKLAGTLHCNGKDIWIMTHDWNSNNFRAYLITSGGINPTPVISSVGSVLTNSFSGPGGAGGEYQGSINFSSNGKNLVTSISSTTSLSGFEVYDFDNSNGIVSNPKFLGNIHHAYGCQFSQDGSMLYGTNTIPKQLFQWDLCSGNSSAIASSLFNVHTSTLSNNSHGTIQLSLEGKLYVTSNSTQFIGVINNPNQQGAACNYAPNQISIAPKVARFGLPNFISSYFKQAHPSFSFSVTCRQVAFTALSSTVQNCSLASYPVLSSTWNFGDPASGTANISTVLNPVHLYSNPGTYTAQLVLNYKCSSDTLKQVISVTEAGPSFSISGKPIICAGESATLATSDASLTYSWTGISNSASIAVKPTSTTVYTVTGTATNNCSFSKTVQVTVNKCLNLNEENIPGLKIYPTPVHDFLTFESVQKALISISDIGGRVLIEKNLSAGTNIIDVKGISAGTYLIHVQTESGQRVFRILIE